MGEINFYDSPPAARPEGLPAPRLQLRWEETPEDGFERVCFYELVFPLREHDCRNDAGTGHAVIRLGRTRTSGGDQNWSLNLSGRILFRDGVHAAWDSHAFGGLPIFVIAPDGTFARHTPRTVEDAA